MKKPAGKGKKQKDDAEGDKPKPPIIIDDHDIREMNKDELIKFNRYMMASLHKERVAQCSLNREIDLLKSCIDNIRRKLDEIRGNTLIALEASTAVNPEIDEVIQLNRKHLVYLEYNKDAAGERIALNIKRDKETFLERRKNNETTEEHLWTKVRHWKEKLDNLYKKFALENIENPRLFKKKYSVGRFYRKAQEIIKQRKALSVNLALKRDKMLKEFYLHRYYSTEAEGDVFWHNYRKVIQVFIEESKAVGKHFLHRLITYDEKMTKAYDSYLNKVEITKKQIQDYKKIIQNSNTERAEVESEMKKVRAKAKNIRIIAKNVVCMEDILNKMSEEKVILRESINELNEKSQRFKGPLDKRCNLAKAALECDTQNGDDDDDASIEVQRSLRSLLTDLAECIAERVDDLFEGLTERSKFTLMHYIIQYLRFIYPMYYETIKNVKSHNDLIEFIEKYIQDMEFKYCAPFNKIEDIGYRRVPNFPRLQIPFVGDQFTTDTDSDCEIQPK